MRWFSLVPPLLAIVLVIWLHNAILALFVAVWSGAVILSHGNFFNGFIRTLGTYLIGELAQIKDAQVDHSHLMIIFFTMFLGAMVGVKSRSAGHDGAGQLLGTHHHQTRARTVDDLGAGTGYLLR